MVVGSAYLRRWGSHPRSHKYDGRKPGIGKDWITAKRVRIELGTHAVNLFLESVRLPYPVEVTANHGARSWRSDGKSMRLLLRKAHKFTS
jgi:hypothetical protein